MTRRLGAIDIGTNSVRLLVADVSGDATAHLDVVDRRMRITRLGQGVDATRRLHPDAVARTLVVLREYRAVLDALGAQHLRVATTSASRDATNRDEFFRPGSDVLGVAVELISGDEEAELSFLGATAELAARPPYLVVDIGGGSTELAVGTAKPEGLTSIDVGCVRLTEQLLLSDPPAPEELSQAVSVMRDHLADVDREMPGARHAKTLVGLAGTVSTLAAIDLGLVEHDSEKIHHHPLSRAAAEDLFRTLATETADQRRHNPGLEPGRVDVIVGGAIVLVSILRHYGFDEVLVSEADILDGLVRSIA